jgi:hypothetical protein
MLETCFLIVGCLFLGWALRGMFDSFVHTDRPIGSLKVNRTDPDGPYLFLELDDSDWQKKLSKKSEVTLRVKFKD